MSYFLKEKEKEGNNAEYYHVIYMYHVYKNEYSTIYLC